MASRQRFRAITYIDGFNLYFGIVECGWRDCLWLDLSGLSRKLTQRSTRLLATKYFTARIRGAERGDHSRAARRVEAKRVRQSRYLEAIQAFSGVSIYEGYYLNKPVRCETCGAEWLRPEEKKTDVQLATQLITDAYEDRFDTAIVVSGDGDLLPPIEAIASRFPAKRIVAAFPPARVNPLVARHVYASFTISRQLLKSSQLPNPVTNEDGHELWRPDRWR